MRNAILGGLAAGLMSTAAIADPMAGAAAKAMLYPAGSAQVQIVSGAPITKDEATLLAGVVAQQPYFGAVAISPDEKLLESKATIAVANFHSSFSISINFNRIIISCGFIINYFQQKYMVYFLFANCE